MVQNPKEEAEAKLKSAQQRLEQEDTLENRKAVEDAKREVADLQNQQRGK